MKTLGRHASGEGVHIVTIGAEFSKEAFLGANRVGGNGLVQLDYISTANV